MAFLHHPRMPAFGGATGWLNSEPLGPDVLCGRVVVVDFWTLTCINWLRTEPYVRAWSEAYSDDGLREPFAKPGRPGDVVEELKLVEVRVGLAENDRACVEFEANVQSRGPAFASRAGRLAITGTWR